MPATKNENQVAASSSSVSTGGSLPSAMKMSRSCSHESQNACVKMKRAGMCPNGDSPMPSQSGASNSATNAMNASVFATELRQDFGRWQRPQRRDDGFERARRVEAAQEGGRRRARARVRQRHDPELVGGDDVRDDVADVPLGATGLGLPLRLGERDERIEETVPVPEPRFDRVAQFGCDVDGDAFVVLAENASAHGGRY